MINIDKDLLVIPSQALHINRDANIKNELNPQIDMLPIISLSNDKSLNDIIRNYLEVKGSKFERICDYDLYLYNRDKLINTGVNNEFVMAPRLDDLASVYPSLVSFINSENDNSINIMAVFNNEEIGSLTQQGADSTFLNDILERVSIQLNLDKYKTYSNSFMISADNAHAIHPNAANKSDPTNKIKLNNGVVIKHHINYTTDALSSSLFKELCKKANVPYQDYECKSDMRCGSTLGNISLSHVSLDSLDIGLPQLSMHSANEIMGSEDLNYMYNSLLEFYNTYFVKDKNKILLKK